MKKIMIMMAVVLASTCCFAQKKAVATAKNKAMSTENPDFVGARQSIAEALVNDETKGQANTWFVAGLIGYKEIEYNVVQSQVFGKTLDEAVLNKAVNESYDYWMQADKLAQTLVADKKGNMKPADPKLSKQIAEKVAEYYQKYYLVSYAINLNNEDKSSEAYDVVMKHLNIPALEMMQEPKLQEKVVRDTTYYEFKYYAGLFAKKAGRYDEAKKVLNELCNEDADKALKKHVVFACTALAEINKEQKDTVAYVKALEDGFRQFPDEPWFIQSLINHYISVNEQEKAIDCLNRAIEKEPSVTQYRTILGRLYSDMKNFDAAMAAYNEALAINANDPEATAGLGYIYMDKAAMMFDKIDSNPMATKKEYDAAMEEVNKTYHLALPYLEKAHELDKENIYYLRNLKSLYFRFRGEGNEMNAKYEALDAEIKALGY
ncbi:MAG: tetratricopeptide repeat protein [Paludibacteraceae bacterium]|nr:tetratricopeptide repeat protein [Paludibacteraceae bacterium]